MTRMIYIKYLYLSDFEEMSAMWCLFLFLVQE